MLQNASFAMGDTSGPARLAALRVTIAAVIGVLVMFPLDRAFIGADGIEALGDTIGLAGPLDTDQRTDESLVRLGAVGLAIGSAIGAWVELMLLASSSIVACRRCGARHRRSGHRRLPHRSPSPSRRR